MTGAALRSVALAAIGFVRFTFPYADTVECSSPEVDDVARVALIGWFNTWPPETLAAKNYATPPVPGKADTMWFEDRNRPWNLAAVSFDEVGNASCHSNGLPWNYPLAVLDPPALEARDRIEWFDILGRRLQTKPVRRGVYVIRETRRGLATTRRIVVIR